jgi:hypothetical protein
MWVKGLSIQLVMAVNVLTADSKVKRSWPIRSIHVDSTVQETYST